MASARSTIPTAAVGSVPYATLLWVDGAEHAATVRLQEVDSEGVRLTLQTAARVRIGARLEVETDRHGRVSAWLAESRDWGVVVRIAG